MVRPFTSNKKDDFMKKVISIVLAFALIASVSAATRNLTKTAGLNGGPSNIAVYAFGSGSGVATNDTIAATSGNILCGPVTLGRSADRPMAKGFACFVPAAGITAACTLGVEYQIIPTQSLADTCQTWTAADTIKGTTGAAGKYVDISSKAGSCIVWKVKNLTGTATAILKYIRFAIVETSSDYVDTKK